MMPDTLEAPMTRVFITTYPTDSGWTARVRSAKTRRVLAETHEVYPFAGAAEGAGFELARKRGYEVLDGDPRVW